MKYEIYNLTAMYSMELSIFLQNMNDQFNSGKLDKSELQLGLRNILAKVQGSIVVGTVWGYC